MTTGRQLERRTVALQDLTSFGEPARRVAACALGMLRAESDGDQPAHVVGVAAAGALPAEVATQPGVTRYAVRPVLGLDAGDGVAVPVTTRHAPPLELLEGRRLLDECDGMVLLATTRPSDGGPPVRVALGVARSGDEVHARVSDGEVTTQVVPADRALLPDGDRGRDDATVPRPLVAAARRYLGLPTAPASATPWLLLADAWATWATTGLERGRRLGSDLERVAWDVLGLRPDMALFTQQRTRAHLVAGGHQGTPTAVELRDAYADPTPELARQLPHRAIRATDDPTAALAALDAGLGDVLTRPGALWDAACVSFDPPSDVPTAAPEWFDGQALVRRLVRDAPVTPGAAASMIDRGDLPEWFVGSTRRLLAAGAAAGVGG